MKRLQLKHCVYVNAAIMVSLALYLFLIPAVWLVVHLNDPGLSSSQTPRFAFRWHRSLTPRYEQWAKARLAAGPVPSLDELGVSGTEWPVFGSVFYLWATDDLQQAVEKDPSLSRKHPRDYARHAIKAATALVVDPGQATWVKEYWGDNYLNQDNLFYRMLLISAMTSYERLIQDGLYIETLRSHTESLAAELDASPHGLLDDYPDRCYPVDIVAAIAAIKRADTVLGTDHEAFVQRALRGFEGTRLHPDTALPGYLAHKHTGQTRDVARGIGLSFMLIWAADLWPETAQDWYQKYEQQFWQEGFWCAGFREYSRDIDVPWLQMNDPDAGPVFSGYGTAACAFGIPAAQALGRYDHLRSLTSQALISTWPLAHGTLLGPRVLSNLSEAPYLGEAATLFAFSHQPQTPGPATPAASLPRSVYVGLGLFFLAGFYGPVAAMTTVRRWHRESEQRHVYAPGIQGGLWISLVILATIPWWAWSSC
ncbi:MAG: hypothetical protein GY809_23050 [Planctomycetes bacterium]|nr:hypothetical protein [Planctomycetota bacterium]